ncbi:MAG: 50S ribosomal protein L25 [Patescibacteria group bacterium]
MLSLKAEKRSILGRKTKQLRKNKLIPAVVYGHKIKAQNISVPYLDFEKVYRQTGESTLINLNINNEKPIPVLIHDIQFEPLTNKIQHIDFYQIRADEKVTLEIGLKFVGQAPAVKELGGILTTPLTKLKIECLPQDLIHELEVDISGLKSFEDIIRLKDLVIPPNIKVLASPDEVIALVKPPRKEEEIKAIEEKPVEKVEEVEVIKEKPKEKQPSEEIGTKE